MAYSIYDSFLSINDCKYYCNQLAIKLNLQTYDYYYDKSVDMQFPGDSNIYEFNDIKSYERWRIKFNLTKPKTISKMGIENYILNHKELVFNLTIKGFRFLYICQFYNNKDKNLTAIDSDMYVQDKSGQLRLNIEVLK